MQRKQRWSRLKSAGMFGLFLLGTIGSVQSAILEEIDHAYHALDSGREYYRIVFRFDEMPKYQLHPAGGRIMALDLPGVRAGLSRLHTIEHPKSPVEQVELVSSGSRVVFHLKDSSVAAKVNTLDGPPRVYLDFYSGDGVSAGSTENRAPTVSRQPGSLQLDSRQLGRDYKVVVIDPGHGGWDSGAQGYGLAEKDIVLDIGRRLHAYFGKSRRLRSFMTRTDDTLPFTEGLEPDPKDKIQRLGIRRKSLQGRVEFANRNFSIAGSEYTGDLYISIHVNTFPRDRRVKGFELWIPGDKVAQDEMSRQLQAIENGEPWMDTVEIDRTTKRTARTMLHMITEQITETLNPLLARHIEKEMRQIDLGFTSRGVKEGPFRVLKNLAMPSVLVEVGFISNRDEVSRYLSQQWFRQYTAYSLYTAVNNYFEDIEGYRPERVAAPRKPVVPSYTTYVVRKGDSLDKIGRRHGISYAEIKRVNNMSSNIIRPGQRLRIPVGGA
jgi:N-acetylmuramoyl-L-alanine amidase